MPLLIGAAIFLFFIIWAVESLWAFSPVVFILVACIPVVGIWAMIDYERNKKIKAAAAAEKMMNDLRDLFASQVDIHAETLMRKFRQTAYKDDYGRLVQDKWISEKNYFIDNVLKLSAPECSSLLDRVWMMNFIDEKVVNAKLEIDHDNVDLDAISPIDFEHHCADILRKAGWDARVTQASGDQGVDIVAEMDGMRVVFQCKKYSTPVGNAAVQEVIAGKVFEQADVAAVVTNSSYTKSAKTLAQSSGVHLLHVSDLAGFKGKIKSPVC